MLGARFAALACSEDARVAERLGLQASGAAMLQACRNDDRTGMCRGPPTGMPSAAPTWMPSAAPQQSAPLQRRARACAQAPHHELLGRGEDHSCVLRSTAGGLCHGAANTAVKARHGRSGVTQAAAPGPRACRCCTRRPATPARDVRMRAGVAPWQAPALVSASAAAPPTVARSRAAEHPGPLRHHALRHSTLDNRPLLSCATTTS